MQKFAIIDFGMVQNVIVSESAEIAEEITGKTVMLAGDAEIGFFYNEETGELTAPVVEEPTDEEPPVEDPAPPQE